MTRNSRITGISRGVALLVLVLTTGCAASQETGGEVRAYELDLTLRADGSVRVEERARVAFAEGTARQFALVVPEERIDGVDTLVGRIDGEAAGGPGVELRSTPGGGLFWTGRASVEEMHEFALSYDARGVMAVRGARGVFVWPGVPPGSGLVEEATIRLEWPEGSVPMQGPAVGGDGWEVSMAGTSAVMTARRVDRSQIPLVYVDLVLADTSVREPTWQVTELQARQLAPAFVSAGLFFIIVAAGILVMVRIQHPAVVVRGGGSAVASGELGRELTRLSVWRASPSALEALAAAGLIDRERLAVGRGLRLSGLAVFVAAIAVAAVIPAALGDLGPTPFAVPAGLAVSGLMLFARGVAFPVLTEAGAEVAMLHSRRLRPTREP